MGSLPQSSANKIVRIYLKMTEAVASQAPERKPEPQRLESIDQFRGFTVAGMFLVNFVGGYACVPAFFRHHNTYCSFADTIMPQFFLAVGLTYRLTFMRRLQGEHPETAARHALFRNLSLLLLGFVVHGLDGSVASWAEFQVRGWRLFIPDAFERNFFQTLSIIAVTSIWVLPVIGSNARTRSYWMFFSVSLWLVFALIPAPWSGKTYVEFALNRPVIDGGPLAFLTWSVPLLVGSLACDWMTQTNGSRKVWITAILLMAMGYGISCIGDKKLPALPFVPPPASPTDMSVSEMAGRVFSTSVSEEQRDFLKYHVNAWTMSQRVSGPAYLVFSAGFGLMVFQLFRLVCDNLGWRSSIFHTLGINALAGYILHPLVASKIKPFIPKDAPLGFVLIAFAWYFLITWAILRHLEKTKTIIRI